MDTQRGDYRCLCEDDYQVDLKQQKCSSRVSCNFETDCYEAICMRGICRRDDANYGSGVWFLICIPIIILVAVAICFWVRRRPEDEEMLVSKRNILIKQRDGTKVRSVGRSNSDMKLAPVYGANHQHA